MEGLKGRLNTGLPNETVCRSFLRRQSCAAVLAKGSVGGTNARLNTRSDASLPGGAVGANRKEAQLGYKV